MEFSSKIPLKNSYLDIISHLDINATGNLSGNSQVFMVALARGMLEAEQKTS